MVTTTSQHKKTEDSNRHKPCSALPLPSMVCKVCMLFCINVCAAFRSLVVCILVDVCRRLDLSEVMWLTFCFLFCLFAAASYNPLYSFICMCR